MTLRGRESSEILVLKLFATMLNKEPVLRNINTTVNRRTAAQRASHNNGVFCVLGIEGAGYQLGGALYVAVLHRMQREVHTNKVVSVHHQVDVLHQLHSLLAAVLQRLRAKFPLYVPTFPAQHRHPHKH